VVVFRIDAKTGELTPSGVSVKVPAPMCVRFVAQR
jgi:6-phosphogluconolactonase (cycloisomerase 2 family)